MDSGRSHTPWKLALLHGALWVTTPFQGTKQAQLMAPSHAVRAPRFGMASLASPEQGLLKHVAVSAGSKVWWGGTTF